MKALLALAILISGTIAHAQNYSITSSTISGGGGTSSGTGAAGNFAVTGAIGQFDTSAASSGGSYAINGGFLAQYTALQQIGAPRLTIRGVGSNVQVVWGANVPGWVLQQNNANLNPANWTDVVGPPIVNGTEQFHQYVSTGGKMFFRLRKL